jgi:hypothetical protein
LTTDTIADQEAAPLKPRVATHRFRGEVTLAVLAGFVISLAFNWEIVRHPRTVVLSGIGDPLLQSWELAWNRHLFSAFGTFWTSNMFYPAKQNFAFTDSLLGYLPLSFLFGNDQYAAILRYNVAYLIACALAFIGAYLLTRQLGGNWQAAALAGVVFAWAPWRLLQNAHLNILSTGGIVLALFALARGHGYSFRFGLRPELAKPRWAVVGWLVAAWQVTIGFATGVPFIYAMGLVGAVIVVVNVLRRRQLGRRLLVANGVGMVIFLGITALMAIPYLRVVSMYHFTRSIKEVRDFSPPPQGLLTASAQTWLWRGSFFNDVGALPDPAPWEKMVFPGIVVIVFALIGLVVSAWSRRVRIVLGITTLVVTIFALGTTVLGGNYTYLLLWRYLPGWDALRTPGRLIIWTTLLVALLAAGAITRLTQLLAERGWQRRLVAFALLLPALGALAEGVPAQTYAAVPGIPPDLHTLFTQSNGPILILPETSLSDFSYLIWSTDGFPLIANGNSGNFPPQYQEIIADTKNFPDQLGVAVLDQYDIHTVVVLKVAAATTPYAAALNRPLTGLPVTKTESQDMMVFTIH